MKLTKCNNGHFYDADKYQTCPHCSTTSQNAGSINVEPYPGNSSNVNSLTRKANPDPSQNDTNVTKKKGGDLGKDVEDAQKTVGIFVNKKSKDSTKQPVTGWLVCIDGEHFGEDFKIRMGRNFIGRGKDMDIILNNDAHVSRSKHAIIVYEPKSNLFIVQAGESKELSYLNDEVVLSPKELKPYDVITLGSSKLMFVPFCCDKFTWKADEEKD